MPQATAPRTKSTWNPAVYTGHEDKLLLGGVLWGVKGGRSLSIPPGAFCIELHGTATTLPSLAHKNGEFIWSHLLLLPSLHPRLLP